jgi:rfaE bifunctional protein nucleotidyltransferase chain/domain
MLTTLDQIAAARAGKTLVFTNGVFDILHAGHVACLEAARELGDLLIVGLNSDESVRRLGKGPERPINPLEDRARVVGALRCVDGVLAFGEDTPVELIERLRPDIHVKGGDYRPEDLPETPVIEAYGGRVVVIPLLEGRSTTRIVQIIRPESAG